MPQIQNPFQFPNLDPSLTFEQLIERNLDFYYENLRRVAAEYGGELVTDKHLAGWLMKVTNLYKRRYGKYPDILTPPQYPLEEFMPLQIGFTVTTLKGAIVYKWYFVRKPRSIIAAGIH